MTTTTLAQAVQKLLHLTMALAALVGVGTVGTAVVVKHSAANTVQPGRNVAAPQQVTPPHAPAPPGMAAAQQQQVQLPATLNATISAPAAPTTVAR